MGDEDLSETRSRVLLAALATAAVVAAVVVAVTVFPLGSINRDESSYIAAADMLVHGRVTLSPAADLPFRPWASGLKDGRLVLKYTPPWPAALAVGRTITGHPRAAAAASAAVALLLVYALALEVLGERRLAIAAALFFGASPLVLLQSGTALSYVFQLVLELGCIVLLLRGARRRTWAPVAAAGLLFGIAAFARPFDAVLFVAPFAAWLLLRDRRRIVAFALGAVPAFAVFLAYDQHVMGSPFALPFTVTGATDGFGFGRRGIFPELTVPFTAADGLVGTLLSLGWLAAWSFGGPLLVALAVAGVRAARRNDARRGLLGVAVLYPVAYTFFWGTYAVVHYWRGASTLGPFYHLPLLVPLAIFGAAGLPAAARRVRARPGLVVAAMAVVTAVWFVPKVAANEAITRTYRRAEAAASTAPDPGVLLMSDRGKKGYDSWTPFLQNRLDRRQPVLYAEDGYDRAFHLVDRFPDRRFARFVATPRPNKPRAFSVVEIAAHRGPVVPISLDVQVPAGSSNPVLYVVEQRREVRRPLGTVGAPTWTISPPGGSTPDAFTVAHDHGILAIGLEARNAKGHEQRWEVRVAYRVVDGEIDVLGPGRGYRKLYSVWVEADVRAVVADRYGT